MGQLPQLQQARRRLGLALDSLCHDRWVLGYLRSGWLQPIAASEVSRRFLQGRPLMPLARRALYEQRPTIMNALVENPHPSMGYDWEMDWPALLYAPVGDPGVRPIGLLVIGCRRDHWYTEEEVASRSAWAPQRKRRRGRAAAELRAVCAGDRTRDPGRRPRYWRAGRKRCQKTGERRRRRARTAAGRDTTAAQVLPALKEVMTMTWT